MAVSALKWIGGADGFLELVDQRKLPGEFAVIKCRDVETLFDAIRTLAVRGAPAIGVAAAYGLVLAITQLPAKEDAQDGLSVLEQAGQHLAESRPTAVNLSWAIQRVFNKAAAFVREQPSANCETLRQLVLAEANAICEEDVEMCRRIGENGQRFITDGAGILTHCNAGALATAGQGTALAVIFEAHRRGRKFEVFVDETRPLLQGSRLTAWELAQAGIKPTVICDNMAAALMKQGRITMVITGADRIAANGDTANKTGTYSLSILAGAHGVGFYVAAPSSTFDLTIANGLAIPIENRPADEVSFLGGRRITPDAAAVYNPAFDVTNARDITAIITDRGVLEKPDREKILCLLGK